MNPPLILIVDDIFPNRQILVQMVRKSGWESIEASNGEEALEIIKSIEIDVVLMDVEMPVMNGIETVHYIRNELSFPLNTLPVIALTAHNPRMFFEDFHDAGFDDLLAKPYSLEKLRERIISIVPGLE